MSYIADRMSEYMPTWLAESVVHTVCPCRLGAGSWRGLHAMEAIRNPVL